MKYFKLLTMFVTLCFGVSCIVVPVPKRVGIRGPVKQEALAFLEKESATREEVLFHLGRPEAIYKDERIFDYKWIGAWNIGFIGPGGSGSWETQKCTILRFHFDEKGTVEDVYIRSYKPKVSLASNSECRFDAAEGGTRANILNILRHKISADYTFVKEGQTSRQEVWDRLGWADVGLNERRLFWLRWAASSTGIETQSGYVTFPDAIGKINNKSGTIHNLLIEFDESAIVTRMEKSKRQGSHAETHRLV